MLLKKAEKRIVWLLLCVMLILACVFACASSAGAMQAKVLYNGKCTLDITVEKADVENRYGVKNMQEFKEFFEGYMRAVNDASGVSVDQDMVVAHGYGEKGGNYTVSVKTRRLDKLSGVGNVEFRDASRYATFQTEMEILETYSNGIIFCDRDYLCVNYPRAEGDPTIRYVSLINPDKKNRFTIAPVDAKTGEAVGFDAFRNFLKNSNEKIVVFRLFNFMFAKSVTLTVGGKIGYYSSGCIVSEDGKTLEIRSRTLWNGTESYESMIGYFTYKPDMSPAAIFGIVAGCICGAALIAFVTICVMATLREKKRKRLPVVPVTDGQDNPPAGAAAEIATQDPPAGEAGGQPVAEASPADARRAFVEKQSAALAKLGRGFAKHKTLYLMLLPGLALLLLFHYLPLMGLVTAFQDYDIFDGYGSEIVGLRNFRRIFYAISASQMYQIFRNTIFISLIRIASNFPIILALALVVNSIRNKPFKTVFQNISFIPYFISWTAASGMAYALLNTNQGLLNTVFMRVGMDPVVWYNTADVWWGILAVSSLWKGAGWGTLIYLAAMCNIDAELYEACALDGGGVFRQTVSVTVPSIMNIICLQLILDASSIMKDNYEQILALVPGDTTQIKSTIDVIGKFTYSQLGSSGMGAATAMGLIQSAIGLILVVVVNRIVVKSENEGIM